jgi:IclR family pca regulon transcriptional regulator
MTRSRHFINSLEKGLSILNTFSAQKSELTLTELARANDMTLGTAHRYLFTLKELGYLTQNNIENKKYRLTTKVLSLGFSVLNGMDLKSRVLPEMFQLTRELDVTTQCAILVGTEIVYIERVRSSDVVNLDLTVGSRLPAYCTSMGKVILAFMDEKETRKLIGKMNPVAHTPYTITDRETFRKELELTRQRGYAINNQELTLGLRTLAVPIFKQGGRVEAALGLSYPYHHVEGNNLEAVYVKRLFEISKKVSMGH